MKSRKPERSATRSVVKKRETIAPGRKANKPDGIELDRLYKELQIHQAELEEQNLELREVQLRLEESRDRYADLYDFAPVGYVDLGGRGSIRSINLKGATMLGESRSRLLGIPFTRFMDPNDRGKFLDHLKRCRQSKGTESAEVVLRPKNAPIFPAQLLSVISPDRGEDPVAFRTAITDLTERRFAEEALRESEQRFRSLVKHAMIGFFIAREGKIAFMNPEQEKLFGQVPESLPLEELASVHPEDRARFLALCREDVAAGTSSGPLDIRLFPPGREKGDREVRWVHCRGTSIFWGGRKAILVNMLDVTRTRDLERIALVQEKLVALGHVAAGIAHEIRNPLSGINIYLSSLEEVLLQSASMKAEEKDRAEECLRHLKTASARISSVVQRVMAFARPIPPTFEIANVNRAIEEAVAISAVTLKSHGVELMKSLPEDLPKCYIDPRLLEQVILNLITNADQAMDGRKGHKRLEIRSYRDGDGIVIKVSDSGPGVPPHLRERIFDPYFTTRSDGTGIGLSFSNRVVTVHGGVLSVGESPLGGAEFRIRIPVRGRGARE